MGATIHGRRLALLPDLSSENSQVLGGMRMRNLERRGLDAGTSHHWGKYCSYADKYRCDIIQYLRDIKEINSNIKKDRPNSSKVNGLF